jgi:hypothetical protein
VENPIMRALQLQEVTQVSGGKVTVTVDVNVKAKYVHVNVVDGTKVITVVNVDWSKYTTA